MWHCALISCNSSQFTGLVVGVCDWVLLCVPFTNSLTEFYFTVIAVTIIGSSMAILFILNYTFRLSVTNWFWFCKCAPPWIFPQLDIPFECWIERATFGLFYGMFRLSTRIFYRGGPGFATDCPCGVWCCEITTCLMHVGPRFGNPVWNDCGFVSLT